jgi:predicted dehydrogenase
MKTIGIAAAAVGGVRSASAQGKGRSERLNVGVIGIGIRGYQLHKSIVGNPHARVAAISDISDHYIERIKPQLEDPHVPVYRDYKELLDDDRIDAVVIASPDHWHAQMTIDALQAGKDVYVEKPLTYSLEEAIQVRDAARQTGRVTQVGYQRRSIAHFHKAREIVQSGLLGEIHQLQLWLSRNYDPPPAPWRAYNDYHIPGLPEKSGPEHVDWNRFQANRPARPYDPLRFFHWQCYEEYSTGIFGILMSHPLDAANLVMDLGIPETAYATGGIYEFDDGRTVPDHCSALFNYPSHKLSVSFVGCSTNAFMNQEACYRGSEGTMELSQSRLRIYAEDRNDLFTHFAPSAGTVDDLRTDPIVEERSSGNSTTAHLEDFFHAVKNRGQTKAPIEQCFKAMVAVAMAIQSYQSGKSVRWDAEHERIVTAP